MTSISGSFTTLSFRTVATEHASVAKATNSIDTQEASRSETSNKDFSKPISEVVSEAQGVLDAGYLKLGGIPAEGRNYAEAVEYNKAIGLDALDRRSLYAVASTRARHFPLPRYVQRSS